MKLNLISHAIANVCGYLPTATLGRLATQFEVLRVNPSASLAKAMCKDLSAGRAEAMNSINDNTYDTIDKGIRELALFIANEKRKTESHSGFTLADRAHVRGL